MKLYDALGNEVAELVNSELKADTYTQEINTNALVSGTYVIRLTAGSYSTVRTITVVK